MANCRGAGVCLIDFGRAIDVWAFPEHTMFEGSNETDGFQCVQMLENKPWKWQVCACVCVYSKANTVRSLPYAMRYLICLLKLILNVSYLVL